jgi:hypothetical protein
MAEDVVMTSSIEPSRNTEYLEIRVQRDESAIDAMRLLEAIATIIDGPIADTRLHDWSGLPERVRLKIHGWQPIATAPEDQEILGLDGDVRRVTAFIDGAWMFYQKYGGSRLIWWPKQWAPLMLLPAPPDAEETR